MARYASIVSMSSPRPTLLERLIDALFDTAGERHPQVAGQRQQPSTLLTGVDAQHHDRVGAQPADARAFSLSADRVVLAQVGCSVDTDDEEVLRLVGAGLLGQDGAHLDARETAVLRPRVPQRPCDAHEAHDEHAVERQQQPLRPSATRSTPHGTGSPRSRAITRRWISLVPSPISSTLASRYWRATRVSSMNP